MICDNCNEIIIGDSVKGLFLHDGNFVPIGCTWCKKCAQEAEDEFYKQFEAE